MGTLDATWTVVGGRLAPRCFSLARQVSSCLFAVGLGSEVTNLGLRRYRRRLAGSGTTGRRTVAARYHINVNRKPIYI
jgi:hypothetical protein